MNELRSFKLVKGNSAVGNESMSSISRRSFIFRNQQSLSGGFRHAKIYQGHGPRGDPSSRLHLNHITLWRCPHCLRIQEKPRHRDRSSKRDHHVCCHPYEMQYMGTKLEKIAAQEELLKMSRVWDSSAQRPRYPMTRPIPKSRNNYSKKRRGKGDNM